MAIIRVPAPSPQAFRKSRPISDLVKSQIKHFQHLEHKLQLSLPTKFSPHDLTTEAAAAQYIAEMTTALRGPSGTGKASAPILTPPQKPDSTPARRSPPKSHKPTRQSRGIAKTTSSAPKKSHAKKHASAKSSRKKS
jgi:hypothetical protein